MKYAIVESGGKQYKAVEGGTIEVDRLPVEAGAKIDLDRVLLVADGDNFAVGTPTVDGIQVKASVLAHFKGPKIIIFKYHPKKRYRVKGGHRQQYTRLLIEQIGKAAAAAKAETPKKVDAETRAKKVDKAGGAPAKAGKPAARKATEAAKPTKSTAAKKPARAKSTKPAAAKKKTTKSTAAKKSTKSTKSTTAAKSSKASTKKTSAAPKTKKSTKK